MLKGISSVLSPELLATICAMGHGDELVLADAHFPGHSFGPKVIRADGLRIADLLDDILPLFEIDSYVKDSLVMMAAEPGDALDPEVEKAYLVPIRRHAPGAPEITRLGRFAFYERSRKVFAIVVTGERAKYGNLLIKKGVTP